MSNAVAPTTNTSASDLTPSPDATVVLSEYVISCHCVIAFSLVLILSTEIVDNLGCSLPFQSLLLFAVICIILTKYILTASLLCSRFFSYSLYSILKRDAIASRAEMHSWEQQLVKTWEEVPEDEQVRCSTKLHIPSYI